MDSTTRLTGAEEKTASEPKFSLFIVKHFVTAGANDEMQVFLRERNVSKMTWYKLQAAGTAYQEAHGREAARKPVATPVQGDLQLGQANVCLSVCLC